MRRNYHDLQNYNSGWEDYNYVPQSHNSWLAHRNYALPGSYNSVPRKLDHAENYRNHGSPSRPLKAVLKVHSFCLMEPHPCPMESLMEKTTAESLARTSAIRRRYFRWGELSCPAPVSCPALTMTSSSQAGQPRYGSCPRRFRACPSVERLHGCLPVSGYFQSSGSTPPWSSHDWKRTADSATHSVSSMPPPCVRWPRNFPGSESRATCQSRNAHSAVPHDRSGAHSYVRCRIRVLKLTSRHGSSHCASPDLRSRSGCHRATEQSRRG